VALFLFCGHRIVAQPVWRGQILGAVGQKGAAKRAFTIARNMLPDLRAYPSRPHAFHVMRAQARWSIAT